MFKNLKVSAKLFLGFGIILLLSIIMMTTAVINLQSVGQLTDDLYQKPFTVSSRSLMIQRDLHSMGREMRGMCLFERPELMDNVNKLSAAVKENIAVVEDRFLGDKQLVANISNGIVKLEEVGARVCELVKAGKAAEGAQILEAEYRPLFSSMVTDSQGIVDFTMDTALKFNNNASKTLTNTTILLIGLLVIMAVISLTVSFMISNGIRKPVQEIEQAARDLAAGKLDTDIQYRSRDELGSLADNMRQTTRHLSAIIGDLSYLMNEMAGGNFDIRTQNEDGYVGDFRPVLLSIRDMNLRLCDTLSQIDQASDQVSSGSDQVSSGAQALSQGATEQASSVEELAATITEISSQVKETAENASGVRRQTDQTGEQILLSNQQMQEMIAAMDEISDKSGQISKIIKAIEDIAFQTNILALNAAVEAARAGVAGKGFAVVADEVRNLASKSAEASKSTASLIEDTIQAVERGTNIANATAQSLLSVVEGSKEVVASVEKIAYAAEQQANSIAQVTTGIDQISSVVQTNSATAEESAAASEELSGQAQVLKNLVGQFKLRDSRGVEEIEQPRLQAAKLPQLHAAHAIHSVTSEKY